MPAAVVLVDLAQPRVDLVLSEADVRELAVGQRAVVTADSLPGQELAGVVSRIGPLGTPSEGVMTYPVEVKLDAPLPLPLGTAVRLAVPIAERDDVLVVPERALHRAGGEASVQVAGPGAAALRAVTVGASNGEVAEITSGLEADDVIVLDGAPGGGPQL